MKHDESGLFDALEKALKSATEPLDAGRLFDMAEIKECASTMRRVSDYLGNMWRKNLLVRTPAPKGLASKCLWVYEWKGGRDPKIYDNAQGARGQADGLRDRGGYHDNPGISVTDYRREAKSIATKPVFTGFLLSRSLISNEDLSPNARV